MAALLKEGEALMAAELSLILGGVRSGKSAFAERLAGALNKPTLYVATALATDSEMEERIRRHRFSRPSHWVTLEEPLDLARRLDFALTVVNPPDVILIDSLDNWVGNLLLRHKNEAPQATTSLTLSTIDQLLEVCRRSSAAFFLVSSEVGHSPVPPYPLGRRFQDLLGEVNQKVAAAASHVYLVIAGIPVEIKGLAAL
jgi:adenosylcobinamide kinase/adenosylcobinamide-phosphate guanylyltransferase